MNKLKLILGCCVILVSGLGHVHAGVIKNAPGISNLEWADFSMSRDLKRSEVIALLANDNAYAGYRYASISEVESLLNSYAGVSSLSGPIATGWYSEMGQDSAQFYSEFGLIEDNGSYLRSGFLFGEDGEAGPSTSVLGFVHGNRNGSGLIYAGYYHGDYGWDVILPATFQRTYNEVAWNSGYASMLVREVGNSTVPEPTSCFIFATLGLLGCGARRRKLR